MPLRPTTRLLGSNPSTLVQKDRPVGSCSRRFCRVLLCLCVFMEQAGSLDSARGRQEAAVAYRKPPYRTLPRVRPCDRASCVWQRVTCCVSSWLWWVVACRHALDSWQSLSRLCLLQHTPVPAAPCTQCHRGIPSPTHSLFCATLTARSSERMLVGFVIIHCIFCALLTSGSRLVGACVGCTCCQLAVFDSAHSCLGDASAARLL